MSCTKLHCHRRYLRHQHGRHLTGSSPAVAAITIVVTSTTATASNNIVVTSTTTAATTNLFKFCSKKNQTGDGEQQISASPRMKITLKIIKGHLLRKTTDRQPRSALVAKWPNKKTMLVKKWSTIVIHFCDVV